jgi:hypothetical protein
MMIVPSVDNNLCRPRLKPSLRFTLSPTGRQTHGQTTGPQRGPSKRRAAFFDNAALKGFFGCFAKLFGGATRPAMS